MKIGIKVGDIMTRDIVSVKPVTSLHDCAHLMSKKDIGLVIVKDDEKLKGMVTERDIIWALTKKNDLSDVKASDIMLKKITTIKPSRDIYEALVRMKNSKIRWLPVTVRGNVIGILTIKDILRIEPSLFDIAVGNMNIKEEEAKFSRKKNALEGKSNWAKDGECADCGAMDLLYDDKGRFVCETCVDK